MSQIKNQTVSGAGEVTGFKKELRKYDSTPYRILKYTGKTLNTVAKIALVVVFIFPFFWLFSTALKTYIEAIQYPPKLLPAVPQWGNFDFAWNAGKYPMSFYLKNSIIITVSVLLIQTVVAVPAAYSFARYDFKGSGILFGVVLVAFMVPGQLTFISIYKMMSKASLLKTLWPQIIPHAANAFGIFMLRQSFKQIPEELIESARLDGGSEGSIMFKIMLPMAKSTLVSVTLFSFIGIWNDYFWPFVMTNSELVRPLTIAIAQLRDSENGTQWQYVMAGNVVLVLPILVVYAFLHKRIINGFAYSGIK